MGILRSILTPDADEVAVLKSALDARATGEPVLRELRKALSDPVPRWASKLSTKTEIDAEFISELRIALERRVTLLESYPVGKRRDAALERHRAALDLVERLRNSLVENAGGVAEAPHIRHSEPALTTF
ncbi:hypothetical protein GOEFS_119_00220 [Gordonia effusa NBRC 100432]|uniref:Uncharacterized protein n=1 Tax=Gordonia effusa NBRC 100432 TaxID=1077974 RepID=H0R631_9ACTN|nr:hypothetical protein [Gordonia effusa]GAB20532.1 hypothetical protein GOEFS_119_00220 [Gordonia effusa NBRC 100432]